MADASTQFYYLDGARNQQGPVSSADIVRLIRSGMITRETLIWHAGMTDWSAAGQVAEFAALLGGAPPPPRGGTAPPSRPPAYGRMATAAEAGVPGADGALVPSYAVWGLLWRGVLNYIGSALVIPSPWTSAIFYEFMVVNTSLPDGRRLTFAGKGTDIWYIFILFGLLNIINVFFTVAEFVTLPIILFLSYFVLRWVCEKTGCEDGSVKLAFTGSIWAFFGWNVLSLMALFVAFIPLAASPRLGQPAFAVLFLVLSLALFVLWAWAVQATLRWICRNVSGTLQFAFVGSILGIFGTTLALFISVLIPMVATTVVYVMMAHAWWYALGALLLLLIPFPWIMRWYVAWFVSRIHVADQLAAFD